MFDCERVRKLWNIVWVNEDFDEEYDSPVMKKLLNDFPKSKRRVIFPQRDEVDMMNEGEMKD